MSFDTDLMVSILTTLTWLCFCAWWEIILDELSSIYLLDFVN